VVEALERDNFMDPEQALDWGLIDEIVESRGAMRTVREPRTSRWVTAPALSPNMRL
jgi:enoyl-CoA hydratase/carnithine racemase